MFCYVYGFTQRFMFYDFTQRFMLYDFIEVKLFRMSMIPFGLWNENDV